jgi:hypothetical protein
VGWLRYQTEDVLKPSCKRAANYRREIRWRAEIIEISEEDFTQTIPMIDVHHFQVEVDRCGKSGWFSHVILLLMEVEADSALSS